MAWFAVVEKATDKLKSLGTVLTDIIPPELEVILLVNKPLDSEMWDETTRTFIPRPLKILVDRFNEDLLTHVEFVQFQNVYNKLNPGQQKQVRNDLIKWLGNRRFRNNTSSILLRD